MTCGFASGRVTNSAGAAERRDYDPEQYDDADAAYERRREQNYDW